MEGFDARPCQLIERPNWAEFLDRNFGYEHPQSYAIDFAPLFEPDALSRSRLFWKEGRIVSSAALYPVTAVTGGRRIRLAVIGAVATDERYRGLGLSSAILGHLEALARAQGIEGIVLWSDQRDFYAKCGYHPAGFQHIYAVGEVPKPARSPEGAAVYAWDAARVPSLYERHSMRMERPDSYWRALEGIRSCTRVQWIDNDGQAQAYLAFDRGRDLQGIVHEWGGEPAALHALLCAVLARRPNLCWLTHPALPDPIRPMLKTKALVTGPLGLFKPLGAGVSAADMENVWFWGLDSL